MGMCLLRPFLQGMDGIASAGDIGLRVEGCSETQDLKSSS